MTSLHGIHVEHVLRLTRSTCCLHKTLYKASMGPDDFYFCYTNHVAMTVANAASFEEHLCHSLIVYQQQKAWHKFHETCHSVT